MESSDLSEKQIEAVSENLKLRAEVAKLRARLLENNADLIRNVGSSSSKLIDVVGL